MMKETSTETIFLSSSRSMRHQQVLQIPLELLQVVALVQVMMAQEMVAVAVERQEAQTDKRHLPAGLRVAGGQVAVVVVEGVIKTGILPAEVLSQRIHRTEVATRG